MSVVPIETKGIDIQELQHVGTNAAVIQTNRKAYKKKYKKKKEKKKKAHKNLNVQIKPATVEPILAIHHVSETDGKLNCLNLFQFLATTRDVSGSNDDDVSDSDDADKKSKLKSEEEIKCRRQFSTRIARLRLYINKPLVLLDHPEFHSLITTYFCVNGLMPMIHDLEFILSLWSNDDQTLIVGNFVDTLFEENFVLTQTYINFFAKLESFWKPYQGRTLSYRWMVIGHKYPLPVCPLLFDKYINDFSVVDPLVDCGLDDEDETASVLTTLQTVISCSLSKQDTSLLMQLLTRSDLDLTTFFLNTDTGHFDLSYISWIGNRNSRVRSLVFTLTKHHFETCFIAIIKHVSSPALAEMITTFLYRFS